jgi:hypothetical protein
MVVPLWPGDEPPTSLFYAFLGSYVFIIGMISGSVGRIPHQQIGPNKWALLVSFFGVNSNSINDYIFCNFFTNLWWIFVPKT